MSLKDLERAIEKWEPQLRTPDPARPIWILGTGDFGRAVGSALRSQRANLQGFLETRPRISTCLDLPVKSLASASNLGSGIQVVVGIFNRLHSYADIMAHCEAAGIHNVFWPYDYYHQVAADLGWRYWLGPINKQDVRSIGAAYELFAEERSRVCFERVVQFRLGNDLAFSAYVDKEAQYFSDLTLDRFARQAICYVDCGAYDGDSYRSLAGKFPVSDAYLFEPDLTNHSLLVETARAVGGRARCLPLGVSDRCSTLSFAGDGESGAVVTTGKAQITAAKLDDLLMNIDVDLIKLDVEGSEIEALSGARSLIGRSRPTLCISLYHRCDDLWKIPNFLSGIVDNYSFYLRQHMHNSFDLVLYGIPKP